MDTVNQYSSLFDAKEMWLLKSYFFHSPNDVTQYSTPREILAAYLHKYEQFQFYDQAFCNILHPFTSVLWTYKISNIQGC